MSDEHRWCRFSRWGWTISGVLACYILFMHSTFIMERQSLWQEYDQRTTTALNAQIRRLNDEYQRLYLQTLNAAIQMRQDAEILSHYQCATPPNFDFNRVCYENGWRKP
jgi:hypothetical protein